MDPPSPPPLDLVADAVGRALETCEAELKLEQAVYGLDSRSEVELHATLAERLSTSFAVAREVHYPSSCGKKLAARNRCDLVLTELGRPLRLDSKPLTLFDDPASVGPPAGLWLEVKIAQQFRAPSVPHGGYGQQWRQNVVKDLKKLEAEPLVHHAALLLVVFTEAAWVAEKDVELFEVVLAEKEVLAGFRQVRTCAIVDRIGHGCATAALWPTVQRGEETRNEK